MVNASRSSLVELALSLRSYRDRIVLVGRWVPYFLIEEYGRGDMTHIGSIDIDLAIDPSDSSDIYQSIVEIIETRGYKMKIGRKGEPIPSSFTKIISYEKREYEIQVDLLTSQDPARGGHRTRTVGRDLRARMIPECSIAFRHNFLKGIMGTLPGDGEITTEIRMLDISGCLGMKGILLGERYKEKDAYDIYAVVAECLENPKAVSNEISMNLDDILMERSIKMIRERFGSIRSAGTDWVGTFLEPNDKMAKDRVCAKVYVVMKEFLEGLDVG